MIHEVFFQHQDDAIETTRSLLGSGYTVTVQERKIFRIDGVVAARMWSIMCLSRQAIISCARAAGAKVLTEKGVEALILRLDTEKEDEDEQT